MAHVRGLEGHVTGPPLHSESLPQRKAKGHSVEIADEESILTSLTRTTDVAAVAASIQSDLDNANKVLPPPKELRLPRKHFESGTKVQRRMRPRLKTYLPPLHASDSSEDELAPRTHPLIERLYNSLGTSLSAYDRSTCENVCWAQKYSPQTTAELLQPGKEGCLLKEWLLSLKIDSVDTGADPAAREKPLDAKARAKKKRKKALEGFIVDSDDDASDLDEVSGGEETWVAPADRGSLRSVIRHGDVRAKAKDGRLTNAVVLSGPHGCGKTAAVYAIAKELDYEVFEINASSRRSGKDVLERVGDMTRNHLVHHQADDAQEDRTEDEVKSGKQGTMTSFFKPNAGKQKPKVASPKVTSPKAGPKASGTKHQKQSLILLEEVDILYEEDKQFWATITTLMAQSKRPFVMTCNDETLVPLQSLSLHGIFRFLPPPVPLAVDAMLLAAAGEGHVLERGPVEELYVTRGRDMRAALAELNYWCQIGVGDRRGGMDWFYLRWPAGSDRDERGDVVRVVSEGTYQSGMGWFGDAVRGGGKEELVRESWEGWGVGCDGLLMGREEGTVAEWSECADAMSAADVLSDGMFGQGFEVCATGDAGTRVEVLGRS
ncbi:AAA family ATPase [Candidatus Bathyarchaeota archaeon]|nr:AAA family ATPase [Candidatus Bathyarchaeota archaeon]